MSGLDFFKNSYTIVPIVALITLIFVFIDAKINDKKLCNKDYINAIVFSSILASSIVFLNSEPSNGSIKTDSILKGPAPF